MNESSRTWCERLKQDLSFRFLSPEQTRELAPWLECRQLAAGEKLWGPDGVCQGVGFIVAGQLEVRKPTSFPGKNVLVALLGPGSFVGEFCLTGEAAPPVVVIAPKGAELLFLSADQFARLKEDSPQVALQLLQGMLLTVSKRLEQSYDRLATLF